MALRRSIPVSELRESRKDRGIDDSRYATTYQGSRGGWFKSSKPEPKNRKGGQN